MKRTILYDRHKLANARFTSFAGWEMPLYYGSQIEEHHAVRQHAGLFDVSHMGVVDIQSDEAQNFLRYMLANDIKKLMASGKALYSCMLNERGGVVDDLICYRMNETDYRIVWNAGTREKNFQWFTQWAEKINQQLPTSKKIHLQEHHDLSILAVQGPKAIDISQNCLNVDLSLLKPFHFLTQDAFFIGKTGYTGEEGIEILVPHENAIEVWDTLTSAGVIPSGLGARDTLRLEAGFNLYGQDMDEETSPYESNLSWTVDLSDPHRDFVGKTALIQAKNNLSQKLVGVLMESKGVLRHHQKIVDEHNRSGIITSGSFSPTLQCAIGFARVPMDFSEKAFVERRGEFIPVKITKPSFIKKGKKIIEYAARPSRSEDEL